MELFSRFVCLSCIVRIALSLPSKAEKTMKRSTLIILAVLVGAGSSVARAQSPSEPQASVRKTQEPATVQKSAAVDPGDSVTIADVQRAADNLAIAVRDVVRKVTESPELKVAALKLAASSVTAAQVIVTQQAATLQATLDALARDVAAVTAQQQSKLKTH